MKKKRNKSKGILSQYLELFLSLTLYVLVYVRLEMVQYRLNFSKLWGASRTVLSARGVQSQSLLTQLSSIS